MRIRVKMKFEGQIVEGSFTINDPQATVDQVIAFAREFCRENQTSFVGVM